MKVCFLPDTYKKTEDNDVGFATLRVGFGNVGSGTSYEIYWW
jgi:hypothetical protein